MHLLKRFLINNKTFKKLSQIWILVSNKTNCY